ncbi:carotenoid oxygenase [Ilyonectria destructans]|nr:carotenoid oxygenase [Ilyonectria destructans]
MVLVQKPVRTFEWKNSMPIHTGASWEENGDVYFDATVASSNAFPFLPTKRSTTAIGEPDPIKVNYVKFKISPDAASDKMEDPEVLVDLPCEFPRTDERFLTKKARYTYLDCFDPKSVADPALLYRGLNCLGRFDYETKELEIMSPGPDVLVQETCFSPRHPEAPEGDGFLITMIDNIPKLRNEVIIQDTKDFHTIIARILLPFRKLPLVFSSSISSSES